MASTYPAQFNTYVADHEASGRLTVTYSRNPKKFPLNKYIKLTPVTKSRGYYLVMDFDTASRITDDGREFAFPDGARAPREIDNLDPHEFLEFRCQRYAYSWELGNLTIDEASWDIDNQYDDKNAQLAMTSRTKKVVDILTTAGNYDAAHTAAVTAISGVTGTWDASTTARQDIQRSLNYAVEKVMLATDSVVKHEDLQLVISPGLARRIRECQEIVDYLKGSPFALEQIKGSLSGENPNSAFGLPSHLYGVELVVEDTVVTTSRRGATRAKSFVMPDAKPVLTSRPGVLEGKYGGPEFSTVTVFIAEEMTVERFRDDQMDRLTYGRVVENFVAKMTSSISGFLFTGAV